MTLATTMHNKVTPAVAQLERHIIGLLRGAVPDITTELVLHGSAAIKIPIKIENVKGELRATVGIAVCLASGLYIASPGEEVGGGTKMDHL